MWNISLNIRWKIKIELYIIYQVILKRKTWVLFLKIHWNKFDFHIISIVNRANRLVGLIKWTFKSLNVELFLILYKTLVRSVLGYGGSVYYPSTKKNIQLLENLQRHATQIVPQLRGLTYRERLERLNLPTLYYRRKCYDLIQLFKIVHGYEDIKPEKFFEDNCSRGHIFKITKPSCRKSMRLNSFPVRCINQWNSLDEDIVCSDTLLSFKTRLDRAMRSDRFNLANIY